MGSALDSLNLPMEEKRSQNRIAAPVLRLFVLTLVCTAAGLAVLAVMNRARPDIRTQFKLYVEQLAPQSKLVVASATQHYHASKEFTARLLALFDIRASIRLSAMADMTYVLPADKPQEWDLAWYPREKRLVISTPEPECLMPAVHTDTIEIVCEHGNLLTNTVFRLKEEAARMRGELSADLMSKAQASLQDSAVRETMAEGVRTFARAFCERVGVGVPSVIEVRLGRVSAGL